ncbi:MAG: hypothetical protein ACK55Z_15515, partial [bacterium]
AWVELGVKPQSPAQPLGDVKSLLVGETGHHKNAKVGGVTRGRLVVNPDFLGVGLDGDNVALVCGGCCFHTSPVDSLTIWISTAYG